MCSDHNSQASEGCALLFGDAGGRQGGWINVACGDAKDSDANSIFTIESDQDSHTFLFGLSQKMPWDYHASARDGNTCTHSRTVLGSLLESLARFYSLIS